MEIKLTIDGIEYTVAPVVAVIDTPVEETPVETVAEAPADAPVEETVSEAAPVDESAQ